MTLTTKQKRWAIATGVTLLLIITNPSISAFKAYIGSNTYRGLERPLNFFICSVYRYGGEKYLGVVGNFMDITYHPSIEKAIVYNKPEASINTYPYKYRVYLALKENLQGFNTPMEVFYVKIKDKEYTMRVYKALKENLSGFDKSPDEFITLVNN